MIRRSRHEWDYLPITQDGAGDTLTRACADTLVSAAEQLRLGGREGEQVLVNGHRSLRMQQVVGVLASPSVTLEILPKIDRLSDVGIRRNLVHMLARVFDLEVEDADLTELSWQHEDLLEILIRLFCDRLFKAVHRGLPRRYIRAEEDLPRLRGKLDAVRQFTVLAARPQRLACRYDELSPDIPLNQIMKAAVLALSKASRSTANKRRLAELSYAFTEVSEAPARRLPWGEIVIDRTNREWKTLLGLAELLLGKRFQTTSAGAGQGFALLFAMNTLFEEYVGRTLRRALQPLGFDVQLQRPIRHALTDASGVGRFATRPDIVIFSCAEPVLIIDTKWKQLSSQAEDRRWGVSQADVYQLMAYGQIYRCSRVMLLYPHNQKLGASEGLLARHGVSGSEDRDVLFASLDLADLGGVERRLATLAIDTIRLAEPVWSERLVDERA